MIFYSFYKNKINNEFGLILSINNLLLKILLTTFVHLAVHI